MNAKEQLAESHLRQKLKELLGLSEKTLDQLFEHRVVHASWDDLFQCMERHALRGAEAMSKSKRS